MAWAEKTFFNVDDPSHENASESEDKINRMLKDLPPFMKLTSRKARKILVRYEELKQRHIENLRNNQVFKFVMKVAGFTSERVEKYWKGSDISPFMEKYTPQNIKITKEDLDILVIRAREHALSDMHQFCTEIAAIPMYRAKIDANATTDPDPKVNISDQAPLPESQGEGQSFGKKRMIFNMSDAEFYVFCKRFLLMKKTVEKAYDGSNKIDWYVLKEGLSPEQLKYVYEHTRIFDQNEEQVDSYDNEKNIISIGLTREPPPDPVQEGIRAARAMRGDRDFRNNTVMRRAVREARNAAEANVTEALEREAKIEAGEDPGGETRDAFWTWMDNTPVVHWDKTTAEFWFQRYIAKWLADDQYSQTERTTSDQFKDLTDFRNKYRFLFNNLRLDKSTGKWMRDLTGLRLTKMIRGQSAYKTNVGVVGVTRFQDAEENEGDKDMLRPDQMPTEVPLDFVRPIFNERFAHWKHELVLGEYEKRSMQEADKWLQMTPWAIGKIYLQPSIYAHMQEAHIAITKKWKKFAHLTLEDWLNSEEHAFFFSKLVALCIKTSDILSGKKYGLDKMYMRINLEKRRVMYSIGKLDAPSKVRQGMSTLPPTASQERLIRDWAVAREKGDAQAAAKIQAMLTSTKSV